MKQLLICDKCRPALAVPLAQKYGFGIEAQSFLNVVLGRDHPEAVDEVADLIAPVQYRGMHGPICPLHPSSDDMEKSRATSVAYSRAIRQAKRLGARHLVFHHGDPPERLTLAWVDKCARFWTNFLDRNADADIEIHLENIREGDPRILAEVVDAVGHPNFSLCLDTGHANCFTSVPAPEWPRVLGSRIRYVHLHNNYGRRDEHLGLTDGNIPMRELLEALEEYSPEANWAFEMELEETPSSIEWMEDEGFIRPDDLKG